MLRNYLTSAFRNILKNKTIPIINMLGLTIGFTLALLMLTYVIYENSFDSFHKDRDRIYRISIVQGKNTSPNSMPALAPAIAENIPEAEAVCRIQNRGDAQFSSKENQYEEGNFYYADPAVLKIFTFNFIAGEKVNPLSEPFNLILSESTAKKYFGSDNPVGKYLLYKEKPFKITAVYSDLPKNTHFLCEMAASYSTLDALGESFSEPWTSWGDDMTYVKLKKNVTTAQFMNKVQNVAAQNLDKRILSLFTFDIYNIQDIHWRNDFFYDIGMKGNRTYMYIFLITALLVLSIACFNFMNLSTAKYLDKSKEVGIRKVIGATRLQIVKLFLTESFITVFISLLAGTLVFYFFYKKVYDYLGAEISLNSSIIISIFLIIITLLILVAFIAGSYPAYFLSKFNPAQTTKGIIEDRNKFSFRQISTIFQFTLSAFLILGIISVYKQIDFMKNSDIGMKKDNILLLHTKWNRQSSPNSYQTFKSEIEKNPNIKGIVGAFSLPGVSSRFSAPIRKEGADKSTQVPCQILPADAGLVKTLEMKLIKGRDFSPNLLSDQNNSLLLNETAANSLGLTDPVGKQVRIMNKVMNVIGVVKDFHITSFHKKINPCVIMANPEYYKVYAIKLDGNRTGETLSEIKKTWNSVFPGMEFNYNFLNNAYRALYSSEDKVGNILLTFTLLTVFVTCIGLFGFSQYLASKRIKEIGIRKVLGASISNLVVMFSRKFIVWIIIGCVIGIPFAFYAVNAWLDNFAYHISIDPGLILLAVIFTILATLSTIIFQAVKASLSNPVNSIRSE